MVCRSCLIPLRYNRKSYNSYPHFSQILKYENIQFTISLKSIAQFEDRNNFSINVVVRDERKVFQVSHSKTEHIPRIHLLMFSSNKPSNKNYHFPLIKDLSSLPLETIRNKKWLSERLNNFQSENNLQKHGTKCGLINNFKINFPKEYKKKLKFKNWKNKESAPSRFTLTWKSFGSYKITQTKIRLH